MPTLLGAVLLWDFFTRVMQGVTMAFFEDVWSRNFLNVFATPLSIAEYLAGLVHHEHRDELDRAGRDAACSRPRCSACRSSRYGLLLVPFLLVLFLFGIALGIFAQRDGAAARARPPSGSSGRSRALLSPFAGVFYPLSTLPTWMQAVARAAAAVLRLRRDARVINGRRLRTGR